jgi:uncharacterized protein (DUF427 family)
MASRRIEPGPGQESVWDYPRPPSLSPSDERIRVVHRGRVIADSVHAVRVLETSQPPAYYLPRHDVAEDVLVRSDRRTLCEWKGVATYWSIDVGDGAMATDVAWSYDAPVKEYSEIAGCLAFYAQAVDECWVDDELVVANPGMFYGGWITSRVVGPFKGAAGTLHW